MTRSGLRRLGTLQHFFHSALYDTLGFRICCSDRTEVLLDFELYSWIEFWCRTRDASREFVLHMVSFPTTVAHCTILQYNHSNNLYTQSTKKSCLPMPRNSIWKEAGQKLCVTHQNAHSEARTQDLPRTTLL